VESRAITALTLTLGVAILAGCGGGGGSSKAATLKLEYGGEVAWVVFGVPGHKHAVASALLQGVQSAGVSGSLTTSKPQGPLDCSRDIKIGNGPTVFRALRRYAGQTASLKVYGQGQFAYGVCRGMLSGFGQG
jgi:hypothetical protein